MRFLTVAAIREADALSVGLALPMARALLATPGVTPFLHLGGPQGGPPIAPDRALRDIAERYLAAAGADLALGVAGEVELPPITIRDISGDPGTLLDLAAVPDRPR
jgi:hypothetical protein